MRTNGASITAKGVAFARASETNRPAQDRLCDDPYARRLMGQGLYDFFRLIRGQMERQMPGVFSFLVLRTRYIDDYVARMIRAGIQQLVILGAGLDSRAYRMKSLTPDIRVFEVDHPLTQLHKVKGLTQLLGTIPPHVTFVPIDFDQDSLTRLYDYGYDRMLKTLFIWEGVVYYLTKEGIQATLQFIRQNSACGSSLIFDYIYAWALKPGCPGGMSKFQLRSGANGERFIFGLPPEGAGELLTGSGFSNPKDTTAQELIELYFAPHNRHAPVASFYAMAEALV